jgi:hypothetical protein
MLLIVAGVLLLVAFVACVIGGAEGDFRRREATLRDRQVIQAEVQRSLGDLKALRDQDARVRRDKADLYERQDAILRALARIEGLLKGMAPAGPGG